MSIVQKKPKWSNLRGDYETKDRINEKGERWCQWERQYRPLADFSFHHRGRFGGFYYVTCNHCLDAQNAANGARRAVLKAEFDENMAKGIIKYDRDEPPHQCITCLAYRIPKGDSNAAPREFYQKDNGTWYKCCTWCIHNQERVYEQLLFEERVFNEAQVKYCHRCNEIKLREDFAVLTHSGYQIRSRCSVCRPIAAAQRKQTMQNKFATRHAEKYQELDSFGCWSYTEDYDEDKPCPFHLNADDQNFFEFIAELRDRFGEDLTTAFDNHHSLTDNKTDNVSNIWDDLDRNLEVIELCWFNCKFCHVLHHALKKGPPTNKERLEIITLKYQRIAEFGCGGPGDGGECPFGFHNGPALAARLDYLQNLCGGKHVVVQFFDDDHDNRFENRHGTPAHAKTAQEYVRRTQGCTPRCKMCHAIKTHRCGDNINLRHMEIEDDGSTESSTEPGTSDDGDGSNHSETSMDEDV